MDMSVDFLKNVGAGVVAAFRTQGTPLTDGIVKVASENQLNAEQTARLVETVNQLAYLSGPHNSMDKTAEFPLADYEAVITAIMTPPSIEKTASARKPNPLSLLAEPLEKAASATEWQPSAEEARIHMEREFFSGRDRLKAAGGRFDDESLHGVAVGHGGAPFCVVMGCAGQRWGWGNRARVGCQPRRARGWCRRICGPRAAAS